MEEQHDIEQTVTPDTFAPLALKLLRGVLYEEDKLWESLVKVHELPLRRYFNQIGLVLVVDKTDGFAFLRQPPTADDGESDQLPRLMVRRTLSLDQSILCILLRERLEEHTVKDTASREPIMSLREINELVALFFKERPTQQRFLKDVRKTVGEVQKMGFLEELTSQSAVSEEETRFRVKRILKAFITADELLNLKNLIAS